MIEFEDKNIVAKQVVAWHVQLDPDMKAIYRIMASDVDAPEEPIKLLEVSEATFEMGRVEAYGFAPTPDVPYSSVFATVTPDEFARIKQGQIALPRDWNLQTSKQMHP